MPALLKLTLALFGSVFIAFTAQATIAIDDTSWAPVKPQIQIRSFKALPVDKMPIFIHTFIHDDIAESQSEIYAKHFLPMVKEIEGTTGRRVSVQFIRHQPTYTDFAYENSDEQATYQSWSKLAIQYRNKQNLPYQQTTKFLLLTRNSLNSRVGGIAGVGEQVGIASLKSTIIVGHEVGHMLDASHENGEVLFRSAWWCDSYMVPSPNILTSNCNIYTDANRERINAFLKNVP
ncbi:hypothetical protein [Pseudomonas sp. ANT_H12B]|uniref:hypothetical protein n=1 Tax=Pseudomonas sp. ANT_H12B TaxID=2597348 RepID=UPI0011F04D64|nr:hypothetical protein [Pseudomonas sp. ANT_H12B]KAA0963614.1 hypothetical protein FQ185_23540 [Pseudomonas sp. ANT_H12B]